jgi:hypothetical protein
MPSSWSQHWNSAWAFGTAHPVLRPGVPPGWAGGFACRRACARHSGGPCRCGVQLARQRQNRIARVLRLNRIFVRTQGWERYAPAAPPPEPRTEPQATP